MRTGDGRAAHAVSTPLPGGYAGRAITHAPAWGGLVAWDLLFNGISTGLFLVAAICEIAAPRVSASAVSGTRVRCRAAHVRRERQLGQPPEVLLVVTYQQR